MRIHQHIRRAGVWAPAAAVESEAQLALIFSSTAILSEPGTWQELRARFPAARLVACSTAGEIADTAVHDDALVCTGITFEHSHVAVACETLDPTTECDQLGARLIARLPRLGLVHVLVLSEGLRVNGSALVKGIVANLPSNVMVTGGLSADGTRFQRTAVCVDGPQPSRQIVAVGFYGERLEIGYGSLGGWDPFGPERRITRANGSVLAELDGEPALDLYKRYLGEHAAGLPASGLLFPLAIRSSNDDPTPVVRTIIGVDETARTLTFAGDMPVGYRARLMRANFERLIDGASAAAQHTRARLGSAPPDLAILVSCVGRKLVLKQRIEEEVEAVRDVLGATTALTGFYSYGEISAPSAESLRCSAPSAESSRCSAPSAESSRLPPFTPAARCELHNQTMTITTIRER